MACELSQTQLQGYFDGELDVLGATAFEKHLESCADCKRLLAAEESLRSTLQQASLYEAAPRTLRENLLGPPANPLPKPAAFPARPVSWRWLALAAAILLAALLGWQQLQRSRGLSGTPLVGFGYG